LVDCPNTRFNADIADKPQMQVKRMLCRRLTEPPFLLNDLPKTEGDTTEKIEKEGQE